MANPESDFILGNKAKDLLLYTMQVCSNDKVIPKRMRFVLGNRMEEMALSILEGTLRANEEDLRVNPAERFRLQKKVLTDCMMLEKLIEVALEAPSVGVDAGRAAHWTKLSLTVRYMCASWYKKDRQRFAPQNR
ncbi:MAG: four helix bundle protein [Bacteroides sp.]